MTKSLLASALVLALSGAASAQAQPIKMPAASGAAKTGTGVGVIRAVDPKTGMVTIQHEPENADFLDYESEGPTFESFRAHQTCLIHDDVFGAWVQRQVGIVAGPFRKTRCRSRPSNAELSSTIGVPHPADWLLPAHLIA